MKLPIAKCLICEEETELVNFRAPRKADERASGVCLQCRTAAEKVRGLNISAPWEERVLFLLTVAIEILGRQESTNSNGEIIHVQI